MRELRLKVSVFPIGLLLTQSAFISSGLGLYNFDYQRKKSEMAITTTQRNELLGLAVTMFKAAPGVKALGDLVGAYEAGSTLESIAANIATWAPFQNVYPAIQTVEEFADSVVAWLLPTGTPAAAVTWSTNWIIEKMGKASAAGLSTNAAKASVLVEAAKALMATDNPNYAAAQDLMLNRIEVANHYSVVLQLPTTTLVELQDILDGVTADPASVQKAIDEMGNLTGSEFTLTAGPDSFTGTTGNDIFNALTVTPTDGDVSTFTSFDKLDGGKGIDTLNIFSNDTSGKEANDEFPVNATVTNIEIININNTGTVGFGPVNASKFVGATEINQISIASAVTELGAGTTAGFESTLLNTLLEVRAADTAASVSVALTNLDDGSWLEIYGSTTAGNGALNNLTITGTVVDGDDADTEVDDFYTYVRVGKDVQTLTVNSAVNIYLDTDDGAGTKKISTVDASASTGNIFYDPTSTVANVSTGSGDDVAYLNTALSGTVKSASLNTGAGKDSLGIFVTGTGTVTVDAGEGDDTVTFNSLSDIGVDYKISGGAGTDTLEVGGGTLVKGHYTILNEVVTDFESIKFTTTTTLDGSQMAGYKAIEFTVGGDTATGVASDQHLTTWGNLTADGATATGTLNITAKGNGTITANTDTAIKGGTVNLTIVAENDTDATVETTTKVTLVAGDSTTAVVTLTPAGEDVGDLALGTSAELTKLTISGVGTATVDTANAAKLAMTDASGLSKGGLTYTSADADVETIKLSAGVDKLTLTNSTVKSTDIIEGFTLVANAGVLDTTKSDDLGVGVTGFAKTTITGAASLNLALNLAADDANGDELVFTYGGDTYVYVDKATTGDVEDGDLLVKLVGIVDLDLLVLALNS